MTKRKIRNWKNKSKPVKKLTIIYRWPLGCLFLLLTGCKQPAGYKPLKLSASDSAEIRLKNKRAFASIEQLKPRIEQGDMILRTGNDFTSESLRQLSSTDKTYSHCGIASIENDSVFVYHALGGEWNPDEKLRRDPLELFCNPEENRGFGIFSFNFTQAQKHALDSVVKAWYKKGVTFDMAFDLSTDNKLYCAEFVSKAINTATAKQVTFSTTRINTFEFVAVDNLFMNPHCVEKSRIRFQ
jgi:hypothetical protein